MAKATPLDWILARLSRGPVARNDAGRPARRTLVMVLVPTAVAALAVLLMAATGVLVGRPASTRFHGAIVDPPVPVPETQLINDRGESVRLTDYRGQVVLLFFGYTSCPDVCPMTMTELARVRRALGADGERLRVFMVTVDPDRDTPERLGLYVRNIHPSFGGLTGTPEALAEMYQAFGVYAQKEGEGDSAAGYTVSHTALTYAIDAQGRLRLMYPLGLDEEDIVSDLRALLREGRENAK